MAIHHKQRQLDLIAHSALDKLSVGIATVQNALDVLQTVRSDFYKSGLENPTDEVREAEQHLEYCCYDLESIVRAFANPVRARAELKIVGDDNG